MATSKEDKIEKEFQLNLENSEKIKEEYAQLYAKMVKSLSSEHLKDFAEIISFNQDVVLENFREHLLKDLTRSLAKSWATCNIGVNLSTLDLLKKKFANQKPVAWRPHGKSAKEQTIPIRVRLLHAENRFFEKQFEHQRIRLEEIIAKNQKYRAEIAELNAQREVLLEQINRRTEEMPMVKAKFQELTEKVLNLDGEW